MELNLENQGIDKHEIKPRTREQINMKLNQGIDKHEIKLNQGIDNHGVKPREPGYR